MEQACPFFPLRLYASIWFLLTAALLGLGAWEITVNHSFSARALHRVGLVERQYDQTYSDKYGNPHYEPHLIYTYDVNGITYRPDVAITGDTKNFLQNRLTVPIEYLPEAPERSRIDLDAESDRFRLRAAGPLFIGFLLLVLGGFILGYTASQNSAWKRLKRTGITCIGRVQSIEITSPGTRNERRFLTVEFADQTGRRIEGRTQTLGFFQRMRWKAGDSIRVNYDPQNAAIFGVDLNSGRRDGLGAVGSPSSRA